MYNSFFACCCGNGKWYSCCGKYGGFLKNKLELLYDLVFSRSEKKDLSGCLYIYVYICLQKGYLKQYKGEGVVKLSVVYIYSGFLVIFKWVDKCDIYCNMNKFKGMFVKYFIYSLLYWYNYTNMSYLQQLEL